MSFNLSSSVSAPKIIPKGIPTFPIAWYFRTLGDTPNRITCAYADYVAETDPGWENPGSEQLAAEGCGTGNRPVLVFEKSLFAAGAKPGSVFCRVVMAFYSPQRYTGDLQRVYFHGSV